MTGSWRGLRRAPPPHDGDQLRLALPGVVDLPWGGVSPRTLTRGWALTQEGLDRGLIFQARAARHAVHEVKGQYDLWPTEGPPSHKRPIYDGAPLLMEI